MDKMLALLIGLSWLTFGCAGSYQQSGQGSTTTTGGKSSRQDITKVGMSYKILRANGGQEIAAEAFFAEIASVGAICIGEQHTDPHHHWAQLEILKQVSERRSGRAGALGMEMFQRPFQGVLDDYAGRRISDRDLLSRTGWDDRWGFDFALYAPILALAVDRSMALLALNVSTELRKRLSRGGVQSLTAAERARLPQMVLDDEEHIAWFDQAIGNSGPHGRGAPVARKPAPAANPSPPVTAPPLPKGHPPVARPPLPKGHPPMPGRQPHTAGPVAGGNRGSAAAPLPPDHGEMVRAVRPRNASMSVYRSQVLWDETMAETASKWLRGADGRQMVILAGYGHCHTSAIVRRMRRRGISRVVSVRPLVDNGSGQLAAELAQPVTDYLFVMTPPTKP